MRTAGHAGELRSAAPEELWHPCEVAEARRQRDAAESEVPTLRRGIETANTALAAAQRRVESLERAGEEYRALPTLRLRDAVLGVPLLGAAARSTTRLLARLVG
jgi:hypothetical protein